MPRIKHKHVTEDSYVGEKYADVQVETEHGPYQVKMRTVDGRVVVDVWSPSGFDRHQMIIDGSQASETGFDRVRFRTSSTNARLVKRLGYGRWFGRF